MLISRTDAVMSGRCETPKGLYRVRCLDATFKEKNSKGNPMCTLDMELISPEVVENEKGKFKVAGQKFRIYLQVGPDKIAELFEFMDKLAIDTGGEFDTAQVKDYFRGAEFDMALSSDETVKRYDPKPGQKVGDAILDGEGQPITNGFQIQAWTSDVPLNCNPERVDLGN